MSNGLTDYEIDESKLEDNKFEDINYQLRPAKNMQRKMILDILQRLRHLRPIEEYRYVGFGSPFFNDIKLIHRELNIDDIVSIEYAKDDKERFELNKPFDCVEMKYDHSSKVLPELDWDVPTILWLDYTDELEPYVFSDVREFMSNAKPGSAIFITLNSHPTPKYQLDDEGRTMIDEIEDNLPQEYIPEGVTRRDLRGWGYSDVCRRIINNQITEKYLPTRNKGVSDKQKIEYKQLVNFRHQDSAKMMTIGGILLNPSLRERYAEANFEDLFFVETGSDHYKVRNPVITFDEARYLNKRLPADSETLDTPIPNRHVQRYAELYRYFPQFSESEL